MRSFGRSLVFVWLTLSLAVTAALLPGVANADQSLAAAPSVLKVSVLPRSPLAGHDVTGQYLFTATLTTQDGNPINNVTVSFYEQNQVFGTREALLGTAITDSTGSATIVYQPAQTGSQTVVARFAGTPVLAPAAITVNVAVGTAVPPYTEEPLPFAQISEYLGVVVVLLVVAAWLILLSVLLGAILGVRGAAQARPPAAGRAAASEDVAAHIAATL